MWMQRSMNLKRQGARQMPLALDMLESRQMMTVGMAPAFADVQVSADLSAADLSVLSMLTDTSSDGFSGAPDEILPYPYGGGGGSPPTNPGK